MRKIRLVSPKISFCKAKVSKARYPVSVNTGNRKKRQEVYSSFPWMEQKTVHITDRDLSTSFVLSSFWMFLFCP